MTVLAKRRTLTSEVDNVEVPLWHEFPALRAVPTDYTYTEVLKISVGVGGVRYADRYTLTTPTWESAR